VVVTIRTLTPDELERYQDLEVTYPQVGATADSLPSGYGHTRASRLVSSESDDLDAIAEFLFSWRMHERVGFSVASSHERVELGAIVELSQRIVLIPITAACRVVAVTDEGTRRGFAYGTLPGHPESGEELFMLEAVRGKGVVATVTAFSRPATPLSRAAGPIGWRVQDVMTRRYLDALEAAPRG
jgi:uncharacterized protein (UPF0548 family)